MVKLRDLSPFCFSPTNAFQGEWSDLTLVYQHADDVLGDRLWVCAERNRSFQLILISDFIRLLPQD